MTATEGYDTNSPNLTIIIVGWNTREYLEGCLRSLYKHSPSCMFDVIYVDNGSEDGSANFVREQYSEVIIIENDENLGFQKANNQGLKIAQGRYIILLNPDTVILPATFDIMLKFMDSHSEVGAASPKCLYPDGRIQWAISRFPTISGLWGWLCRRHHYLRRLQKFESKECLEADRTQKQDYAYGAFFTIRRQALLDIGLMDESLFLGGDDLGWSMRASQKGWKIFYVADAAVIHHGSASRNKYPKETLIDWIKCHRYLLQRYRGAPYRAVADIIFLADLGLKLIESFLHRWRGEKQNSVFERTGDYWDVFRKVYLEKGLGWNV